MPELNRKQIRRTTYIYWLLLVYVIAALVWWFITLEKQNRNLANEQYRNLEQEKATLSSTAYGEKKSQVEQDAKRNTGKYIAEGVTFLLLIVAGAVIVFRSVRRQFRAQQQQQHFMMAVTHELKTPLSVTRLNLETLQKYNLEPEKQQKLIRATLDETARLNFLTNNILVSSQLEGGGYHFSKEELDLSTLFLDCIHDFRNRYAGRKFVEAIEPDTDVKGDPLLLQILVNNLLENAIKYSPKESAVTAVLKQTGNSIQLQILDEGPGIPDDEKANVFRKFYRIGNENTRKSTGTGLGLYLCSKIARDHNADITVTNHLPQGSNFTVTFHTKE